MSEVFNDRMEAGWYYVGDLCYVLHDEWNEVCHHIIDGHKCLEGQFQLDDGRKFAIFNTAHGDGRYKDQFGREYSVDAGSIGCIRLDQINMTDARNFLEGGQAIEMTASFVPGARDGLIMFGPVVINTDSDGSEWEDDEQPDEENE